MSVIFICFAPEGPWALIGTNANLRLVFKVVVRVDGRSAEQYDPAKIRKNAITNRVQLPLVTPSLVICKS